jgi:broad specificity phosphatase PhoE
MTRFLLLRHGSTDMLDRGISGRAPGVHLNSRGEREARALAHHLREREVAAIYASPLERTWQTAEALAQQLGLTPIATEALLELHYGEWTARSFESLEPNPHWRNYNAFRSGTRIPGGELMLETQTRAVSLMIELREKHPNASVALVTHGDLIKAAVMYFLGIPLDFCQRLDVAPASCTEVEFGPDYVRVLNLNTLPSHANEL